MNTPNLFVPQDKQPDPKARSRSRLKVTVFCWVAINVIGMGALLVQGCKREQPVPPPENTEVAQTPDTNAAPVDTNAPVASTPVAQEPPPTAAPAAASSEYVVTKGDSFFSIGKKLGVPTKAIAEANPGVDSSKLKIGQKLVIPAASAAPVVASTAAAVDGEKMYVVKSGDTLTKIAKDHGTTYKAIKAANGLTTDRIKVGQKLKIPVKESAPAPAPEAAPVAAPAPAPAPAATEPAH